MVLTIIILLSVFIGIMFLLVLRVARDEISDAANDVFTRDQEDQEEDQDDV